VLETAAKGDAAAVGIVERAAADLARWVKVAADAVSGPAQAVTVVLAGGVLAHSELYRRVVSEQIVRQVASAKVFAPPHEPAYGAAMIGLRAWRERT
jgi:N-acetylglucosamine kinase